MHQNRLKVKPKMNLSQKKAHVSHSLIKVLDKLMFVVVGARDFSPEITGLKSRAPTEFPHKF